MSFNCNNFFIIFNFIVFLSFLLFLIALCYFSPCPNSFFLLLIFSISNMLELIFLLFNLIFLFGRLFLFFFFHLFQDSFNLFLLFSKKRFNLLNNILFIKRGLIYLSKCIFNKFRNILSFIHILWILWLLVVFFLFFKVSDC